MVEPDVRQAHVRPAAIMYGLHTFLLLHVLACVGKTVHGGKIIHGEKAPRNTLQFMVSLQNNHGHVCGGFLITQDFVLTAAHCGEVELTHVILGTRNIKRNNYVKREIERMYMHPDYDPYMISSDIMLLKLAVGVDLNERIHTVALPTPKGNLKVNQTCSVAGWGKVNDWSSVPALLRVANVSVIDPGFCKEEWGHELPSNVVCAGGSGTYKGFCNGDSGGPLVCNGVAVGIVSFGRISCVYPSLPNVYTEISAYIPWINEILKDND